MSTADRTPSERADVCVIGSGPSGALVAHRLATQGHDVVILEAGKRFDPDARLERMERHIRPGHPPETVWDMGGKRDGYTTSGTHYPLNRSRVKGVGGTTLHWQGMVMRFHEKDFEMRSRHGVATDWPIGYEDLQPYYAAAETELGVSGAMDNPFSPPREKPFPLPAFPPSYSDSLFAEACEKLGISMHSVPNARNTEAHDGRSACMGYGTCKPVCPSGAKYTARSHIEKAERAGARLIDQVPVQRLEHDGSGETIEAAVYATPDGKTHRQQAREFVLACGGIETPRLLLLSRSDEYPDGLANSSGLVGCYFMDHLYAGVGGTIDEPTRQKHVGFLTSATHQFYDDPMQPVGTERTEERSNTNENVGSINLEFSNYAGRSPAEIALWDGDWGDELLEKIKNGYGNDLAMGGLVGQLPRKENRVTLDRSTVDDNGNPVPKIHWTIDERTKRTLNRANEIQTAVLDEMGAEISWTVGPENTGPAFHHMGTTRMGRDPNESVVNPRMQTHDLKNVWIASGSVCVTGGAMNGTLTFAALALKAAEHIDSNL